MDDMFRFSQDRRFGNVSFEIFLKCAHHLSDLVLSNKSSVDISVITCEDRVTYNYSTVTFFSDEVSEALKNRKRYSFSDLDIQVWMRSYDVQFTILEKVNSKPFMICLSCDKYRDSSRTFFYGQYVEEPLHREILEQFAKPSLLYGIGDGYRKISKLNEAFAWRGLFKLGFNSEDCR